MTSSRKAQHFKRLFVRLQWPALLLVLFCSFRMIINSRQLRKYSIPSHLAINSNSEVVSRNTKEILRHSIETSRQCSSVLNYIYSGTNVSLESIGDESVLTDRNITGLKELLIRAWLPSIQNLWENKVHPHLLGHVMRWAYSALDLDANSTSNVNQSKMEDDYRKVHNEFILSNLRRSIIHPMETKQMQTLLNIIELRLADPTNNPPLEIMTFGSSVVEGFNSNFHNWWQSGSYNMRVPNSASFAWPARLEAVLNDVVFQGQNVVRVTNVGAGGTCSSSGALALEYRLFVTTAPLPDVIIHSYGHTDARYHGDDADALRIMQDFVLEAKKLRCNSDGLPFVVLYDDYHGIHGVDNVHNYMRYARTVSQVSEWYNLMAASHASAFRHTVMSGDGFSNRGDNEKDMDTDPAWHLPMLGWRLEPHPGMLFHSTSPWVLAYGLLENMVNSCQEYATLLHHQPSYQILSVDQIPGLTPDLLLRDLPMKWKSNIAAYQEMCNQSADAWAQQPCSPLSWLVNKVGGIRTPMDIQNSMSAMSVDSLQNWYAEGRPKGRGKPRPGWVASAPNATFTITIKDTDHQGIKAMSVIAMKSYGAKWEGSLLQITVWDEGPLGKGPSSQMGLFEIEGGHNLNVSVFFDYKFLLGGDGVHKGNWLKAKFDVIGGSTFKLQGILFCQW